MQVPQVIFSVSLGTLQYEIDKTLFVYRNLDSFLFRFGHTKAEDFYIAEPEKAILDTLYMKSKGLVELLPEDIDMKNLDHEKLEYYSRAYPDIVKKTVRLFESMALKLSKQDIFNQYRENTIIEIVQTLAKSEAGSQIAFKGGTALPY